MTMNEQTAEQRAARGTTNRLMYRLSQILGLTTGIGVVAWGAWSLIATIGLTIYERSGLAVEQIVIEDSLNQGMLQSAMLIALGAVILELRRIGDVLQESRRHD